MEILNLIIITLLVPLAIIQFGHTSVWLIVLILWLLASITTIGLFQPVSLALLILFIYVSLISLSHAAVIETRYIRQHLQPAGFRSIIRGTLLRWLLFPVIALLGYFSYLSVNQIINRVVNDAVYSAAVTQDNAPDSVAYSCSVDQKMVCKCTAQANPVDCPQDSYAKLQASDRSRLERDIHYAIDRFFNRMKSDVKSRVRRILKSSRSVQDSSIDSVMQSLFDGSNREILFKRKLYHLLPGLKPPQCAGMLTPLFSLGDCIKNELYSSFNSIYDRYRQHFRSSFINLLQRARDNSRITGQNITQLTDAYIDKELELQRANYHQQTSNWFELVGIFDILSFLIWLLMVILVCLLGLFYIFCRFAYDPRNGNVPLKLLLDSPLPSSVISSTLIDDMSQTDLSIVLGQQTWYVNRTRYVELDSREDFKFPQMSKLFFRRFPTRLWMRQYSQQSGCTEIGMNFVGGGTQVVRLTLGDNDRVVFVLSNLIGFTESITLSSHFSWKLAYLLNRSPFFSCANGPGELLLSTRWQNGASGVSVNKDSSVRTGGNGRANPRDIALLDLHGQYSLNMSQSLINVFWDDHSVESLNNSAILRDRQRSNRKTNKAAGMLRKMLLVPLPVLSGVFSIPVLLGLVIFLTML